ncbi:hypothetical protein P691DRAFT_778206, partial [Macrolepiota fuliginosa MF-IS2]
MYSTKRLLNFRALMFSSFGACIAWGYCVHEELTNTPLFSATYGTLFGGAVTSQLVFLPFLVLFRRSVKIILLECGYQWYNFCELILLSLEAFTRTGIDGVTQVTAIAMNLGTQPCLGTQRPKQPKPPRLSRFTWVVGRNNT